MPRILDEVTLGVQRVAVILPVEDQNASNGSTDATLEEDAGSFVNRAAGIVGDCGTDAVGDIAGAVVGNGADDMLGDVALGVGRNGADAVG